MQYASISSTSLRMGTCPFRVGKANSCRFTVCYPGFSKNRGKSVYSSLLRRSNRPCQTIESIVAGQLLRRHTGRLECFGAWFRRRKGDQTFHIACSNLLRKVGLELEILMRRQFDPSGENQLKQGEKEVRSTDDHSRSQRETYCDWGRWICLSRERHRFVFLSGSTGQVALAVDQQQYILCVIHK
jgi:hypothetical protein